MNEERDPDLVPDGYWEKLSEKLRNAPELVEEPGEDPEPLL